MAREWKANPAQYRRGGEILREAADSWRRAGEHDRAIDLLHEAVTGSHWRTCCST
ncbi:MAG: hypothetical protein JO362_03285 [Streptomycetaceae bacterium]|nr:hypothetical protein [Streptomycetaceae bacterium]